MSSHLKLHARLVGAFVLATPILFAQMGSWNVAEEDLGRPAQPPFISYLGIVATGKMATDRTLRPQGPVAEAIFEELRAETKMGGPAGEVIETVTCKYDEQGRVLEEHWESHGSATVTTNRYQGTRLVSQEQTFPEGKTPRPKFWNYWKYDELGKLVEYRRGSGDTIQNLETNFERDARGRLTGFEYHQGPKNELFSRTAFRYSSDGRTVDTIFYDAGGGVSGSMAQTVDDGGKVIAAVVQERDWRTKKPKPQIRVAFKYDATGRLVEQYTDPYEVEADGIENELPPGKVVIAYDDTKHTKTTTYSDKDRVLTSILTYDTTGAVIEVAVQTKGHSTHTKLQYDYDGHGNWTSCQMISPKTEIGEIRKKWRRTITYR